MSDRVFLLISSDGDIICAGMKYFLIDYIRIRHYPEGDIKTVDIVQTYQQYGKKEEIPRD